MPSLVKAILSASAFALIVVLSHTNIAKAATINTVACTGGSTGSNQCVQSISNLAVAGVGTFDVSFSYFQNSTSGSEPSYLGSNAEALRSAIVAELAAQTSPQPDQIISATNTKHRSFWVADQLSGSNFTAYAGTFNATLSAWVTGTSAGVFPNTDFVNWVIVTDFAPVPIPAALPLLLSALGFFGFRGWRRRAIPAE